MEQVLAGFLRALRAAGSRVSPGEAIDAARTIALVGVADRATLKTSLAAVLAKSREERDTHDRVFDLYFRREFMAQKDEPDPASAPARDRAQANAAEDSFQALAESGDDAAIASALERAAAAVGAGDIRFATQTSFFARRMLEALGVERMEASLMERLRAGGDDNDRAADAMIGARLRMQRLARRVVEERYNVYGRPATETFLDDVVARRSIDALTVRDIARLKVLVARMAKRLSDRHARQRRVRDRGRLDVRRTLRANAGSQGVPFKVIWKIRKKDRPKVVAVCDVSGSVARSVRFLLMFLYAMNEKIADLRTFAFSSRLADVGPMLDGNDFDAAFERILRDLGGGSTDYGQALADLSDNHRDCVDRRTTVVILGDGRSNHADPRLDLFRALADQAKRVVWLSPEPEGQWGSGDSCLLQYRPHCTIMAHCATALDLERAIDDILGAYD